jgi:hypothetical protein
MSKSAIVFHIAFKLPLCLLCNETLLQDNYTWETEILALFSVWALLDVKPED